MIGHSFVSGLNDHLSLYHSHRSTGMTGARGRTLSAMTAAGSVRPENGLVNNSNVISSQLRLKKILHSLHLFGKRGANISNDFDLDYFRDHVKKYQTRFCHN